MKIRAAVIAFVAIIISTMTVFAVPNAAQARAPHIKMCADDNYGPTCYTRETHDSNFHNDNDCDLSCGVYDIDFGDDMSSYKNNSKYWWKLFHDKKYKGYTLCVRPWGYDRNMGDSTNSEDDISSAKRYGTKKPTGCDKTVG